MGVEVEIEDGVFGDIWLKSLTDMVLRHIRLPGDKMLWEISSAEPYLARCLLRMSPRGLSMLGMAVNQHPSVMLTAV